MALTITNYATGDEGNISFTLKGTLPKGIKGEAGSKRGTTVVTLNQQDYAQLQQLGAAMKIAGAVDVSGPDTAHWNWYKDNFVPEANGGGKKGGVEEAPTEEAAVEEEAAAATAEETTNTDTTEEDKTVAKSNKKTATRSAKKAPAAKAKSAPAPKATKAKAAAAENGHTNGKATAAPKTKAAPRPKKEKEAEPEVDTKAIETAIVELAQQTGNIRYTKVLLTRIGRRLSEGRGGVKLLATPAGIVTAGVLPGQTYTVRKNHARAGWGVCDYTIEVLDNKKIKLKSFKGEDHGRGLKSGMVFDTSKDLLKKILKLPDPHVTLAKFFNI